MRLIATTLAALGGVACAALGGQWLSEVTRARSTTIWSTWAAQDTDRLWLAALVLLAACLAGLLGATLAYHQRGRLAAATLLVAGIAPGLIDARAFVVTCVLVLAGILAFDIRAKSTGACFRLTRSPRSFG